jgi:hypothetical protein
MLSHFWAGYQCFVEQSKGRLQAHRVAKLLDIFFRKILLQRRVLMEDFLLRWFLLCCFVLL